MRSTITGALTAPGHTALAAYTEALLILDGIGWRIVSAAFDRERLTTRTR
jgi:hypothetical protein